MGRKISTKKVYITTKKKAIKTINLNRIKELDIEKNVMIFSLNQILNKEKNLSVIFKNN